MCPTRVLVADDHILFRAGIASLIRQQEDFEVVGEAADGEEAVEKARSLVPDLILMDICMPNMGGLEALRRIKSFLPETKVVMLTVSDDESDLIEAIKCGAQGFLLKKMEPERLFETLRGACRGEAAISRQATSKVLEEFARLAQHRSRERRPLEKLSARERQVLELIAQGATNKLIAARLGISENTAKNHLKNILDKLGLENRVQAATYALREGMFTGSSFPDR